MRCTFSNGKEDFSFMDPVNRYQLFINQIQEKPSKVGEYLCLCKGISLIFQITDHIRILISFCAFTGVFTNTKRAFDNAAQSVQ